MVQRNSGALPPGLFSGGILAECLPSACGGQEATPPSYMTPDEWGMWEALKAGMKSAGIASPNPPVGCALMLAGKVLATGHTQEFGGWHAERHAYQNWLKGQGLPQGTPLPPGTEVFTTLEPCSHQGKQPPCALLLQQILPSRVIVGCGDPNPLVAGNGLKMLTESGIPVKQGVLERACRAWLAPFLHAHSSGLNRPFVALKWAQSLDGCLADDRGESFWITGQKSRAVGHWLRRKYDMVGVSMATFLHDKPQLTARDCAHHSLHQPTKVLFDRSASLMKISSSEFSDILGLHFDKKNWVVFCQSPDPSMKLSALWMERWEQLEEAGVLVKWTSDPHFLAGCLRMIQEEGMQWFERGRGIQSIMIEGGPKLLAAFMKNGLSDVNHIFIAPLLINGSLNRPIQETPSPMDQVKRYGLISTQAIENDVLVEIET